MADPTKPILLDPTGGQKVYGNVIVMTFTVPTDADNDPLAFKLEMDVWDPPLASSPEYRSYESRFAYSRDDGHGTWQVQTIDGCWIDFNTLYVVNDIELNEQVQTLNGAYYRFWMESLAEYDNARIILTEKHATEYPTSNINLYYRVLVTDEIAASPTFSTVKFGQGLL